MRNLLLFIVFILSVSGCVNKSNWLVKPEDTSLIVVDGIITDTMGAQRIHITHPVAELNAIPQPVTGAHVMISNEDSVYELSEQPVNSGIYLTHTYFVATLGKNYTLYIYVNNQFYTAKTIMVRGSYFNALSFSRDDNDNMYHIDSVAKAFNPADTAMWEVLMDWSQAPGYEHADPSKCRARLVYYSLPTLDVSQIFAPPMEDIRFPGGTIITERRYSLTPEYTEFLRTLISETNWKGGLFSTIPANVMTNLSKGAIGYFTACSITTLSLSVAF
ncbi:MAG: DUF4249 family protein [Bacteroidetes bacterium]|nr:DUF4249 family protein [Bacteroidota bacterium]